MKSNFAQNMRKTGATVYVVQGRITDTDAYEGENVALGDTEWQFSDGKPGERGYSEDYANLMEGLRDFEGCALVFDLDPRIVGYQVFREDTGQHWNDRPSFEVLTRDTARKELADAHEAGQTMYVLHAIAEDTIEEPSFEGAA